MLKKINIVVTALILLPLCLTNNCNSLSPAPLNTSCDKFDQEKANTCDSCKSGYQLLNGHCYPPCPAGYTQLMPGYCYNSTIIAEHQDLQLCATNSTHITANTCFTPVNSTCHCGPPCPAGYAGLGCTCNFEQKDQIKNIEVQSNKNGWMSILMGLGILTIILVSIYFAYSYLKRKGKVATGTEIMQVEAVEYKKFDLKA